MPLYIQLTKYRQILNIFLHLKLFKVLYTILLQHINLDLDQN